MAQQLFRDFNEYRLHTANVHRLRAGGRYIRELNETPERLAALQEMSEWCAERQIDPRLWLYTLFSSRRWLFAPKWDQLQSEKHVRRYEEFQGSAFYSTRVQSEIMARRTAAGATYNRDRDVVPAVEDLKRRYLDRLQDPAACIAAMDQTLGFHPRSTVCARCPAAGACAAQLQARSGYDIVSLRAAGVPGEQRDC